MREPDEVLFQVTRDCLETGLRGYPIGWCPTSYVEPTKGLFYFGLPITALARKEPEAVIYLLYHGREGTDAEVRAFREELQARGKVGEELVSAIRRLPKKGSPMKLLAAALLLAGIFEGTGNYREDGLNLVAKAPAIVATVINHHAGWAPPKEVPASAGYIERFVAGLGLPHGAAPGLVEAMKLFNILHYDHGGGNLSTFVGKVVASGLEDMYGSMASAILALDGPRHGRANQDCLEFVESVLKEVGEQARQEQVEALLRARLAANALVFGFGHAVLRVEDPRGTIFYEVAEKKYPTHPLVKIALLLRRVGPKVLSENPKISNPYPNVDAISGITLIASGFPYPDYFPVLFGLSRIVGISRQIIYERLEARDKKGTPIVRPLYYYVGDESLSG